ncbi:hypothetical protein QOZ80_3BG0259900 [Eleusine coracana subsp. coracana]|nr:hypothetical protein QOZ80_3BG0259900 [Eleusine coracana subsp. coracana]
MLDLNLDPDQQVLSRRLSFSDADSVEPVRAGRSLHRGRRSSSRHDHAAARSSGLPPIKENPLEEQEAEAPVHTSQCAAPPLVPASSSATLYPMQVDMPPHLTAASVATSMVPAPPVTLQSRQLLGAVAATTASQYHRQLQSAMHQQRGAEATRAQKQEVVLPHLRLYTVAGGCAEYETKWGELHPASQMLLLSMEEIIGKHKYQSQQLDQCNYLHDPSLYNKSFELDASQIMQEIVSTSTIMDREKVSIKGLTDVLKEMMWKIDTALQSYVKLRLRPRFEEQIGECFKLAEELEQLVQMKNDKSFLESMESLPKVMSNTHDYFIHVASKLEDIHQAIEAMKTQYLNARRCMGDWNDPFVEADTRESVKQEATVRMVHPTMHLSPPSQPKTPVTASVMANKLQKNSFPTRATFPSSCPTLPPPFFLPATSTQPSPAPITNPFSSSSITSSFTSLLATPHRMEVEQPVQASTGSEGETATKQTLAVYFIIFLEIMSV